jgi:hypothetical protein
VFHRHGGLVAQHPLSVILLCLVLTGLAGVGFLRLQVSILSIFVSAKKVFFFRDKIFTLEFWTNFADEYMP